MIKVNIYNILGQKVRTLVNNFQPAGEHELFWDGLNESGYPVSSGIYVYVIQAESVTKHRKMVLMR